jgi:hypothetical protein
MEHKAALAYSHTAEYTFIDSALKSRWAPFKALVRDFYSFEPKSVGDFSDYRATELIRLKELNPTSTDESLLEYIDGQISSNANASLQVALQFSDRVMAEYVTVAFLSHALSEAAINAILAIGLGTTGAAELFSLVERADIKEKWTAGPKAFFPAYSLDKRSALYQTLQHLTRQRNAFVHYKIQLEMDGEKKLEGSRIDRAPLGVQLTWIERYFSLPYDLAAHATSQIKSLPSFLLHFSDPIERFAGHSNA